MNLGRVRPKKAARDLGATLYPSRRLLFTKICRQAVLFLSLMALPMTILTACKTTDADDCAKKFDVVLTPDRIDDGTIYIPSEKLEFLFDADYFIIDDTDLLVSVDGQRSTSRDIDLDLNGIKITRDDGRRKIDHEDYDKSHSCTNLHFKPHQMHLNGSEDFGHFVTRIRNNHGEMAIRVHCDDDFKNRYKQVQIELIGRTFTDAACKAKPSPTPSPSPTVNIADYAPKITATDPTASLTNSTNMMITFSALATDGIFFCSLDNAAATKCSSPMNYAGLSNGAHTFQVSGQTPAGLSAGAAASYSWSIDTTTPAVVISNAGSLPTLTNNTAVQFIFSATKAGSTFTCSLDSAAATACTTPATYSSLQAGLHSFQVWATDQLGNVSPTPALFQWTIDLTLPVTSIIATSPTAAITNLNTIQVTFSATKTSNFTCSLDNGPMTACTSPASYQNLVAGNHYFNVQATDLAGNIGLPVSYTWVTDYTAPVVMLGTVVPAQGLTNGQNVSAAFSADKPATFICTLDNLAPLTCASPFTSTISLSGPHTLIIQATDLAGNISNSVSVNWQMDFTAPIISFGIIKPSANAYVNSNNLSFQVIASKAATLSATLNGVAIVNPSNPILLSGLAEGRYTLNVFATDLAGNISNTISDTFAVDLTPPIVTLTTSTPSLTKLDLATFNFSANKAVTYACNLDGVGFAACTSPTSYSGIADGSHTFTVQATDLAGNLGSAAFSWIVDSTPPTTTGTINLQGSSVTIALGSNKSPVSYTCSIDSGALATCAQIVTYSGLEAGPHLFVAYATDAAGNIDPSGYSIVFTVLPPIQTQITSTFPAKILTNLPSMTIAFTATESPATFSCSLDGGAASPCTSPVTYTGLGNGAHAFNVKATDQWGKQDLTGQTFSWTVDTVAPTAAAVTYTINSNSIVVIYNTSKPTTDQVLYGLNGVTNLSTTESATFTTTHSVTLSGLTPNTLYQIEVAGHDLAGNPVTPPPPQQVRTHR